jgi:tetratricopeptide (TPR) repeat protein
VAVAKSVTAASVPRAPLDDQALFGQAMRKLRMENDPSAALSALQEHAKAYPRSSLGGERVALEVEALLALHRDRDALARLDTMALDDLPRSGERFVVRGELRAAARRWQEASADFDRALSRVSGSPAWHERALWGRGAARLRCGEREAGLADFEHYLDKYPDGRFASAAARFFPNR